LGAKTQEVGGGKATGLANETISGLQALLNTGGLGTAGSPNAAGSTGGIFGILSDLLSSGAGAPGKAATQLLSKQQERDTNAIRARFGASGGAAFGTPAAHAEGLYRAEAAPQITQAITGLQMSALGPLLQMIAGFSDKGIAQRQLIQKKSGLGQALGTVAQIGGAALPFLAPGVGSIAGPALAGAAGGGGAGILDPGYQFGSGARNSFSGFYEQ